jgi:hypothetical protein
MALDHIEGAVQVNLDRAAARLGDRDLVAGAGEVGGTAPDVPVPTAFSAAALAFVAASPVTGFSASSWAAEPCAGIWGFAVVVVVVVGVVFDVAAVPIAAPPTARAATATTANSAFLARSIITSSLSSVGARDFQGRDAA